MIDYKNKQKRRSFALLFILLGTMIFGITAINPNTPITNTSSDNKTEIETKDSIDTISEPKAAEYAEIINDTGNNLDVLLHQSLYNITEQSLTNVDQGRIFVESTPNNNFNTEFINISVDNILAPNKSIIYQNLGSNVNSIYNKKFAASFNIISSCYLRNISVYLWNPTNTITGSLNLAFFSAKWDSGSGSSGAYKPSNQIGAAINSPIANYTNWYTFNNTNKYLDTSQTEGNTFFIVLNDTAETTAWYYDYDSGPSTQDGSDDIDCWSDEGPGTGWVLIQKNDGFDNRYIDFRLKCGFYPLDSTPKPTDINLTINYEAISNDGNENKGFWISQDPYSGTNGRLEFLIKSDWWDVSCKITKCQINFTRTGLIASTTYNLTRNASNVYWEASITQDITDFESTFNNYYINITIPKSWTISKVYNGTNEKSNTYERIIGYYKDLQIFDAGNGANWWLNATSTNFISQVNTVVGTDKSQFFFSDNMNIGVNLAGNVKNGEFNISVANFDAPHYENFTSNVDMFTAGSTISLDTWNIDSDPDLIYGKFRVQVRWTNGTEAGFREKIVTVIGNTELLILDPASDQEYMENEIFNITVFYEDTGKSNAPIANADIYNNSKLLTYSKLTNGTDGYYFIEVNTTFYPYGPNAITISANKTFFENKTKEFNFYKVIDTQIKPGYSKTLASVYRGAENRSFTFNYTDIEGKMVDNAFIEPIGNTHGFTWSCYQEANRSYTFWLNSTGVTNGGTFDFVFNISASGNATKIVTLTITVLLPNAVIKFEEDIYDLQIDVGKNITLHFNFTDSKGNPVKTLTTNMNVNVTNLATGQKWNRNDADFPNGGFLLINHNDGNYTLNISTSGDLAQAKYNILVNISYVSPNPGPYNNTLVYISFTYGTPTSTPIDGGDDDGGSGSTKTITDWNLLFLIFIIAAVVGGVVASIVVVKTKVIAPKKRARETILREVTTIFDDAVNLEHILVIYKGTGTCIFFKSYGMEEIDPELISGFLTAVSSFGKEMDSQEALNEIQYGDKMLLLADGEYIRVALVLDKQASIILRQHLKIFINAFEKTYAAPLPKWKGQIDIFQTAGTLVDDKFHTSIILPHEIRYDLGKVKKLKVPASREVLKVAQSLVKDSDRKFFFIATLLMESVDKIGKNKAEIFMGIRELREIDILVPIQISAIEAPPVSQQEKDLIRKQICKLPDLTEEEINKLVNDVALMGPAEREAYLASCQEREEVISAPIKSKAGTKVIANIKAAKKEISNLKKQAKVKEKQGDIPKAVELYNSAAVIATNWDLNREFEELEDMVRITQINGLREVMKIFENEAKTAEKNKDYLAAIDSYKKASKAASEIFKLGITEMTKEVKRLTNKAKELEKLI